MADLNSLTRSSHVELSHSVLEIGCQSAFPPGGLCFHVRIYSTLFLTKLVLVSPSLLSPTSYRSM